MGTTDYTFLSPASLPKTKKTKVVTPFVIAIVVAIACTSDNVEASGISNGDLVGVDDIACPAKIERVKNETLTFTDSYSEKEKMLGKLSNFFCNLNQEGWDGYNAFPIERDSYLNARKIVMGTPDSILQLWNIFPSPNGTISFEFKEREIAAMSVGNKDFSYVAMKESGDSIMEQREFNMDKAVEALIAMSNLLGYFT